MYSNNIQKTDVAFFSIRLLMLFCMGLLLSFHSNATNDRVWFDEKIHQFNVIEVKFLDDSPLKTVQGKLKTTSINSEYEKLVTTFKRNDFLKWQPIFSIESNTLKQWRTTAQNTTGKPSVDLAQFYYLFIADGSDTAKIIAQLRQSPLVAGAYPVSKPVEPPLPPDYETSNSDNADVSYGNMFQRYFNAAPDGMDINYAREGIGGTGDGINICDVEYGHLTHTDLGAIVNLKTPTAILEPGFYQHGTAVMGMLNGKNNGWGTTGLIYGSNFYFSPSVVVDQNINIADAIGVCVNQLNPGDIILIEQQTAGQDGNFVPSEWIPSVYAAIQTAVNNGYIVVAAAGNGSEDLDDSFYSTAQPGHTPFTSGNDSGAIIVGSSNSPWTTVPRTRRGSSTFGSTVDLHGWGHDIIAPSYGSYYDDDGALLDYTLFSGTSGASPMVVAAAAILQANYIAKNSTNASPNTIKQLLIGTGTPQESVNGENIGPFPNLRAAINAVWNVTSLDAPIITPNSGVFSPPIDVTIGYGSASQNSSNTHIRYTLDGSEPTIDSFIYIPEQGDSIFLLYSANVKATAFQSSFSANRVFASATTSSEFNLVAPQVATPIISPNGGEFTQGTSLVITTPTPGATIKYRTDGRAPSFFYPGTTYNGPFNLAVGSYIFAAQAYKNGLYKSDVSYSNQVTITPLTLPAPTLYPPAGTYAGQVTVYIGSTVLGATIRYTTDGSEPSASSSLYENSISIENSATVKAKVYLTGYTPSATVSSLFTIVGQAPVPTISPVTGSTANDSMLVTLSANFTVSNNNSIRYTTNGTTPVITSTLYSSPFTLLPGQHTIKAKSFVTGIPASSAATANFTVLDTNIADYSPTISPVGGVFNGPVTVTLESDTDGVSLIMYTLDASDPATTSPSQTLYTGPFQIAASQDTYFIKAKAYLNGTGYSTATSATFTVANPVSGPVVTPTVTPESGEYNNSISVSVQAPDFSSPFNIRKLYVTRNGDVPFADFGTSGNGSSGVYNFSLAKAETVKALSAQAGWFDSDITENVYSFKCSTPDISTGGTFVDSTTVSISTVTTGTSIYYTLNGAEPTTGDTQYSSPFNISQDSVVKAMCTRNNFIQSDIAAEVFLITDTIVAPIITTQPQAQLISTCDSVTLSVAASGTSPFNYQWYKDGNLVAGATDADLDLLEVNPDTSGQYHVVVGNDAGDATSNLATVIVPIFTSGFEAGETTPTCVSSRSTNANVKAIVQKSHNDFSSEFPIYENNKSSLISSNTGVVSNPNLLSLNSNLKENEGTKDANRGTQPMPEIIPILDFWSMVLLILMILIVSHRVYRYKCH